MSNTIDAEVTIKFVIPDISDNFEPDWDCLMEMVRDRIDEEGLYSLIDETGDFEIIEVKPIQ